MRSIKAFSLTFVSLLICTSLLVNTTAVGEEIENLVEASFNIEFQSGTDLNIEVTMEAQKLTTDETFNANEIKSATDIQLGAFGLLLYQMLKRQLEDIFPNAKLLNFSMPIFNGNTFNEKLNVKLTSAFFGMNNPVNSTNLINGILDISAWINYSLELKAEPGWNNTYKIGLGNNLDYQKTNGKISDNTITWSLKNWDGNSPNRIAEIQIKKKNPTTQKIVSEDIFLEFNLDSKEPKTTSLTSDILLKSIDIRPYGILPNYISNLNYLNSDGIRLFIDNGFFTWDEAYQTTIKPLEENIKNTIEKSPFNQTIDISFNWDNNTTKECLISYKINNMDDKPPVKAILKDNDVNLQICGISARAFYGLINTGGDANISKDDINFGEDLNKIGYEYNVSIYLPEELYLDEENIYTWNKSISHFGEFESDNAAVYDNQEKDTVIVIEVTSTDLNLLSFFTGTTELTFGFDFGETRNYNITELPQEFSLPEKLIINYLNSDAFRLCIEEGVFSQDEVDTFLKNERKAFESKLKKILSKLEVRASIKKSDFEKSLNWDGDILRMDSYNPVKVESSAHSSYPIHFNLGFLPPKFNIPSLKLNFSGVEGHDVTYKMIFQNDVSLSVSDALNKSNVKKMRDGRQYVEISFDASEANLSVEVSCKITPSALFILGVLTPCIVSFIITIILVILILIIRRKRKRKKAETVPIIDDSDSNGYDKEDYYIPPPPSSK